ncbi:MAG: DUF5686 family protein [Flavobacterium sp.]
MRFLTLLLLLTGFTSLAQHPVTGTVRVAGNRVPLAFATVVPEQGTPVSTDIDGRFIIEKPGTSAYITISYTGFDTQKIILVKGKRHYAIEMAESSQQLTEVVVSGENPARAIIREAIRRKPETDPQQKLSGFRYNMYERLIVTAHPDSISGKLDSLYIYEKAGRRFEKIDSSDFKFKRMIEKRHIYQMEKVSEFAFNKEQGLKENVLGTRMAGFKKPVYEIIALKLQSYSVYDRIDLVETRYEGPLEDGALSDFNYKILDTVSVKGREAYMIYFEPRRAAKKKRLEGVLYIDTQTYGVAQAIFRTRNIMDITSNHYFTFEKDLGLWFPENKTLKIVKGNNKEDIKILGETIKFDAEEATNPDRPKEASDFVYVLSESRNFDKQFNIPVKLKHAAVAVEITEEATEQPDLFWARYRDTIDSRAYKTYASLDSLVASENWEQRIILGRRILNGYFPLGPVDIDLKSIIRYNLREGIRLGIGGTTNNKFSEIFRLSGYVAYGTQDGKFKYSGGGAIRVGNFSNSWIGFQYTDDLLEIASTAFATDKRRVRLLDSRPLNISTFYNHQSWQGYIESNLLAKAQTRLQLTRSRIDPLFEYTFNPGGHEYSKFNLTTAVAAIQWNPFSEYMQTPTGRIEIEKRFPKFAFQYTQSIEGLLDSDFTFGKLDFRTEYEKKYINGQKTSLLVQTGVAIGDTPLTHLYSTQPNSRDKESILGRMRFAGKNSFETMYFNEFFSSQYVTFQAKHGWRKFPIYGKLKLAPVLVTRAAWGNLEDKEQHQGVEFNTMEKGYYESGVELNEIYKFIGITAFYRYGPYHLPSFSKNIAVKISININLF